MGKSSVHPTGGGKLTQQHMEGVTNVNSIMDRALRTGSIPAGPGIPNGRKPMFINLSGESFHEMLIKVQDVQGRFAALPAKVRKRFAQNPLNLLKFLEDEKNLREAVSLGLVDESTLSPERKAQMDLVEASEMEELRQFEKWRARRRAAKLGDDPFEDDDESKGRASKADPESQPRFQKKTRTS